VRRVLALLALLGACRAPEGPALRPLAPPPDPGVPDSPGEVIVVCGERFAAGTPVVLWFEHPFYDAYATEPRFVAPSASTPKGLRYHPGRDVADSELRARVEREGWTVETLGRVIDLFVLHYDACGTSRTCFDVLQDRRGLSVHFLLDVDGTIYQTLDLEEQAWHARQANPRSIGIEIAHVGAFAPGEASPLDEWYATLDRETRLSIPAQRSSGIRTPDFAGRPARDELVVGEIQGDVWAQYDFTPEQYEALVKLTRTLTSVFPRLSPDAPRDAQGHLRTGVLSDEELAGFHGILGHYHVSPDKRDPGPAFDWERFLAELGASPRP